MSGMTAPGGPTIPLNLYRVSSPGVARVVSNVRLTPPGCDEVRHIVLDLEGLNYRYVEGQSLGVLTPGVDSRGGAHKLRLYSIASSRLGDDGKGGTASLCVKRVVYVDSDSGQERRGVASNYLCDLTPGEKVAVTGPSGKHFVLPDDPASHLILIATGTGIAPFRAFLRHIYFEREDWAGSVTLIFGVRTSMDSLYQDELEGYRRHANFRLITAYSREQTTRDGRKMYVQDRLGEDIASYWRLLQHEDTHLYVCGLKGMESGIDAVLDAHARGDGESWHELAGTLRRQGRYLIETY